MKLDHFPIVPSFISQIVAISKQQQQLVLRSSTGLDQMSVNTFVLSWRDAQYRPASPSSPLPVNGAITHQGQVLPVSHRAASSTPPSLSNHQACFCPFMFFTWQNKAAGWLQPDIIGQPRGPSLSGAYPGRKTWTLIVPGNSAHLRTLETMDELYTASYNWPIKFITELFFSCRNTRG